MKVKEVGVEDELGRKRYVLWKSVFQYPSQQGRGKGECEWDATI